MPVNLEIKLVFGPPVWMFAIIANSPDDALTHPQIMQNTEPASGKIAGNEENWGTGKPCYWVTE